MTLNDTSATSPTLGMVDAIAGHAGRKADTSVERFDCWQGWQRLSVECFRTTRRGAAEFRYRLRTDNGQWISPGAWLTPRGALAWVRWEAANRPAFRRAGLETV